MRVRRPTILTTALVLAVALSAAATAEDFVCEPKDVAVFDQRIHVRCANTTEDGGATIEFWSVGTADAEHANRFLSVACTALVSGRKLKFSYTPGDVSGETYGCQAKDCRKPWAIAIF